MTTTTSTRTASNGQPRKTLSSQLDRLDGILDGLDAALSGAVQDAVEQAVKQAVQAVLTEVLTNRELQEQLQQASQPSQPPEEPHGKPSMARRLWQATTENVRRTVQTVQRLGRGVGMALVAAGAAVAGIVYAARKQIASAASAACRGGKRLFARAITTLASMMPAFVFRRHLKGIGGEERRFWPVNFTTTAAAATVECGSKPARVHRPLPQIVAIRSSASRPTDNGFEAGWPRGLHQLKRISVTGRGALRGPDRHVFLYLFAADQFLGFC